KKLTKRKKKSMGIAKIFFMLRKRIAKRRLLLDLNIIMKHGKIMAAGKALHNLMFHHHHQGGASSSTAPHEYEFSCNTTPSSCHLPFYINAPTKRNKLHRRDLDSSSTHGPVQAAASELVDDVDGQNYDNNNINVDDDNYSDGGNVKCNFGASPSPILPGFGFGFRRSPIARQLRITDSPFPVQNGDGDDDDHRVDEAAEEFIQRFYKQLKLQKNMGID
ncbi:hypothetical protein Dimus_004298, partial [Dionaea muscipula]